MGFKWKEALEAAETQAKLSNLNEELKTAQNAEKTYEQKKKEEEQKKQKKRKKANL